MKMKRICKTCKKDFYVTPYDERKGKRVYCSILCLNNRGIKKTKRYCKTCKKIFIVTKAMDSGGKYIRKYCSRKCMGIGYSMGHNPHIFKKERVQKICKVCNRIFYISEYESNIPHRGTCCSRACRNKYYIEATLKGLLKRPTSLEKQMIDIIDKYNLPYKYVGDGSFLIGWKNPDFVNINGEKKLIEVGNVYHHQGDYVEKRQEHFAKYGWESYFFITDKLDEKEILYSLKGEQ